LGEEQGDPETNWGRGKTGNKTIIVPESPLKAIGVFLTLSTGVRMRKKRGLIGKTRKGVILKTRGGVGGGPGPAHNGESGDLPRRSPLAELRG